MVYIQVCVISIPPKKSLYTFLDADKSYTLYYRCVMEYPFRRNIFPYGYEFFPIYRNLSHFEKMK